MNALQGETNKDLNRICQLLKSHTTFNEGVEELRQVITQKQHAVSEAYTLRHELAHMQDLNQLLKNKLQSLKSQHTQLIDKHTKTTEQKKELLKYYKTEKHHQHLRKMIKESKDYLKVLNDQVENARSLKPISVN